MGATLGLDSRREIAGMTVLMERRYDSCIVSLRTYVRSLVFTLHHLLFTGCYIHPYFVIPERVTLCHPRTGHPLSSPNGLVGDPVLFFLDTGLRRYDSCFVSLRTYVRSLVFMLFRFTL
jgi:hypothetical protein